MKQRAWLKVCLLFVPSVAAAAQEAPPEIEWEPYETTGVDDRPIAGRLGRIHVPENRDDPEGPKIELAFVHFPSENPEPGPPIVVLAGGPGGPGVEGCVGPATGRLVRLIAYGDVIGLDQRGTGRSVPNLSEGPAVSGALPTDRAVGRADFVAAFQDVIAQHVAHWEERGVDLAAYNTRESADDIDDLRRALGVEQIVPWGSSYGSHLALAYLRRHPEHVARAVITKVEGPDHTVKLPSTAQRHLEQLHAMAAADPAVSAKLPDLLGTVRELLEQLADQPVTVELAKGRSVTLGPWDLQLALSESLGMTMEVSRLPAVIHALAAGDWSWLAERAARDRTVELWSTMSVMMDCASGASPARRERVAREAADPENLLGDALLFPFYPDACAACGDPDLGAAFRGPLECDAPVLFVSGSLDARTPPENVEELIAGFPNAAHVVVEGVGHDGREVLIPEFRERLQAFLNGGAVESCVLQFPFRFAPVGGR